jgi:O-antigen ligase
VSLLATVNVWQWPVYWHGLVTLVLTPLVLWFGVRILARDQAALWRLAAWLAAGGVAVAAWGLAAWLQGEGVAVDDVRRLVGPHFSPNHTALYLERTFFVVLGLVLAAPRRARPWLTVVCLGVAGALLLTGSRGAVLGLLAGLLVVALFAMRRRPAIARLLRLRRGAIAWLAMIAGVPLVALASWQWARLLNWQTVLLREELWRAALALWLVHPWVGVGPGGFFWNYPAFLAPGPVIESNQLHPHNLWLEVVTTWGLLGLAWLGILLWTTWRTRRRGAVYPPAAYWLAVGLAAGVAAGIIHGQTDAFFLLADITGWNALAWAMLINLDWFVAMPPRGLQSCIGARR